MAMLKPLGFEKGKPFNPDARQKKILEEAMLVGNSMAAASTFQPRLSNATFYPGTQSMPCCSTLSGADSGERDALHQV